MANTTKEASKRKGGEKRRKKKGKEEVKKDALVPLPHGVCVETAMTAKRRGLKRRKTEEKKIAQNENNKKEKGLRTKEGGEGRQGVDEEGRRLQAEKEALKWTLHDLKVEHDRERASLSNLEKEMAKLKRTIDECLKKEENLEQEVKRTQKQLNLVQQRMIHRNLPPLPKEIYFEVAKHVHESEALAFSMTCRASRDAMKETLEARKSTSAVGKCLGTRTEYFQNMNENVSVSEEWIKWAFSMKWEYAKECNYNEKKKKEFLVYLAARGGFKDMLVWLISEGCVLKSKTCDLAARGGHINVLKYLKRVGVTFDSETCNNATEGGHIHVLKYLKSEGVGFDWVTCEVAAKGGHIEVLKYLKREGVAFDFCTCLGAAQRGRVNVLKYLKSEGMTNVLKTYIGAAQEGHINVLKYLKSEGVTFGKSTFREAAWGGHLEILKWLRSEEVNCPWDRQKCLKEAIGNGRKEVATLIESFM